MLNRMLINLLLKDLKDVNADITDFKNALEVLYILQVTIQILLLYNTGSISANDEYK